jgi:hypothetical protein
MPDFPSSSLLEDVCRHLKPAMGWKKISARIEFQMGAVAERCTPSAEISANLKSGCFWGGSSALADEFVFSRCLKNTKKMASVKKSDFFRRIMN